MVWSNIFSHGASNSRGCAVLLPSGNGYEIIKSIADGKDRYIIMDIKNEEDVVFTLVYIYCPTSSHKELQINTLNEIMAQIDNF